MRQIDELLDVEAVREIVTKYSAVCGLWLTNNERCARFIEKYVVHKTSPPHTGSMGSAKTCIPYQEMSSSIIVFCVVISADMIFLRYGYQHSASESNVALSN